MVNAGISTELRVQCWRSRPSPLARIWEEKITRGHPELAGHLDAVVDTVAHPDHVAPDAIPARARFYRREVGPSRWLLAVVSYEQQPGRIITAVANRMDPKQWTP